MTSTEIKQTIIKELERRGVTDKYVKVEPVCTFNKCQRIQIGEKVYGLETNIDGYVIWDENGLYALSVGVNLDYVISYFLEGEDF